MKKQRTQRKKSGSVYLVGAGPAGKDLITVRGLALLQQADVVVYDYLTDQEFLSVAKPGATLISCRHLGKNHGGTSPDAQSRINAVMVAHAKEGRMVVRLKNGDPFIFGRASEELAALRKSKIVFEVVPGVSAAQAAAAYCGIPLTDRALARSVLFATGQDADEKKLSFIEKKSLATNDMMVLYMAVKAIPRIATDLIRSGRPGKTPVAAVSCAGRINQKMVVSCLKDIARDIRIAGIEAPAIFMIGENVLRARQFNWAEKNRRILYTGTSCQPSLSQKTTFCVPLIKIEPLKNYAEFDRYVQSLTSFDGIIFTSRYSVQYFFERTAAVGLDSRALQGLKIIAIGSATALRLQSYGITADLVPRQESSQGLLTALRKVGLKGKRIFFPRSDIAQKDLPLAIQRLGADVTSIAAYRNVCPDSLPDLDIKSFDEIVFTSPSGVRNFIARYGHPPRKVKIKSIGDVTRAQLKKMGLI